MDTAIVTSESKPAKHKRMRLTWRFPYADRMAFAAGFSSSLSHFGMFIRTSAPLPIGSRVEFELRLANDETVIRGTGVVRFVRAAAEGSRKPGMGISFAALDADSERFVAMCLLSAPTSTGATFSTQLSRAEYRAELEPSSRSDSGFEAELSF